MDEIVRKALSEASSAHRDQFRKGDGAPYIVHPVRVMSSLQAYGCDDPIILASALLHDAIEDTPLTHSSITQYVHPKVADIVQELTKDYGEGARGEVRKAYVISFKTASPEACLIKMVDRTDNLNDTGLAEDYLETYAEEGLAIFDAITSNVKYQERNRADHHFMIVSKRAAAALLNAIERKGITV